MKTAPNFDGDLEMFREKPVLNYAQLRLRSGEIRRMKITEAHDYDLTGELVDVPVEAVRQASFVQISSALIAR